MPARPNTDMKSHPEQNGNQAADSLLPSRSLWGHAWRQLRRMPLAVASFWVVVIYLLLALYGEGVYWTYRLKDEVPPYQRACLEEEYLPPSPFRQPFALPPAAEPAERSMTARLKSGLRALAHHPLGTDNLGRDVLQRAVQGARIAFQVGIITACIAMPIGILLGSLAGYFGGRVDDAIVWIYTTFSSVPGILFILAIALVVGKGLTGVYVGIGLTTWVGLCRLVRGEVMKHKARPYVQAARALGFGPARVMFRHILPNVAHLAIISFSLRFPAAISTEVFMSFLGIGVQGEPSWGIMISNARLRLWQGAWWEMATVTAAIFFVVLAFNLLGDALRDALDPRLRTSEG